MTAEYAADQQRQLKLPGRHFRARTLYDMTKPGSNPQ